MEPRRLAPIWCLLAIASVARAQEPAADPKSAERPAEKADSRSGVRKPSTPQDLVKRDKRLDVDELLLRGASPVPISELVDELIDDIVGDLEKLEPKLVSPMAVRAVTVSPNLKSSFAHELESRLIGAVAQGTQIQQRACAECRSLKSRVDQGEWVVTLGPVSQADVARLGESIGAKTFFEIDFSYWSGTNTIAAQTKLVRASDGYILWAEAFTSDGATASLLRGSDRVKSREERREELARLVEGRPYYGQAAFLGTSYIPWDNPDLGGFWGLSLGYRLYEKFGPDRANVFGVNAIGFLNIREAAPIMGGFVGVSFLREISSKSLYLPELRVGGGAGGFLVGTEGNSFYVEGIAEVLLKFRLGVAASVFYMYPTPYLQYDLGGLGLRALATFNW